MISFDEFEAVLGEIADGLPREIYKGLNGGILLMTDLKIHPESIPGRNLFVLGEYCVDRDLGRYIKIYYESFNQTFYYLPPERIREEISRVLRHEFIHHLESMAGERDLEIEDAIAIGKYKQSMMDNKYP